MSIKIEKIRKCLVLIYLPKFREFWSRWVKFVDLSFRYDPFSGILRSILRKALFFPSRLIGRQAYRCIGGSILSSSERGRGRSLSRVSGRLWVGRRVAAAAVDKRRATRDIWIPGDALQCIRCASTSWASEISNERVARCGRYGNAFRERVGLAGEREVLRPGFFGWLSWFCDSPEPFLKRPSVPRLLIYYNDIT